jgi:hypothetical protein
MNSATTTSANASSKIVALPLVTLASAMLLGACGTTGGAGGGAAAAPVDLAGTTWKLPATAEGFDGRTVRFEKIEGNRYLAVLKVVGRQLEATAGAYEGVVLMDVVFDAADNTLSGLERIPGRTAREVSCSVSASAREMKCNTAGTVWLRQEDRRRPMMGFPPADDRQALRDGGCDRRLARREVGCAQGPRL